MYVDVAFKGALQHARNWFPMHFLCYVKKSNNAEAVEAASCCLRWWRPSQCQRHLEHEERSLLPFFAPFQSCAAFEALHSQQTADSSERSKKHIIAFFRCRENQSVQPYFRTEMNAFVHCFFTTAANSKILCSIWSISERGKVGEASRWKDEKNYFAQYT